MYEEIDNRGNNDFINHINWFGISFNQNHAASLGLDWKQVYQDMLVELQPKHVRIAAMWSGVEREKGVYDFADVDWMMDMAQKYNADVILVIGQKAPRWPECHVPEWAKNIEKSKMQEKLLTTIEETVKRYKDRDGLNMWQVENEPFLPYFGECDLVDISFLDKEIALVRSLDPDHKIMITDSGELSIWFPAAKRADIFGTTMYRIVWSDKFSKYLGGYITYPLPPKFFWLKANLVHLLYGDKPIIVSELQAEPWSPGSILSELPLEEQRKSMDIEKFHQNIEYAKKVGFEESYLWGAEWWYWMKEEQDDPAFWEAAKELFEK